MGSQLPLSTNPCRAGDKTALPAIARSLLYSLCVMLDSPLSSPVDKENLPSATKAGTKEHILIPTDGFDGDLSHMTSPFDSGWLKSIFNVSCSLPWHKPFSKNGRQIKRSVCWLTDPTVSLPYKYSGLTFYPQDFPSWFVEFQKSVFAVAQVEDIGFNSCNVNYYHDGSEYVDWHADDEAIFGNAQSIVPILSLSIGQSRDFLIKSNETDLITTLCLGDGDLLFMGGLLQATHKHQVPKSSCRGGRLNFTWRRILPGVVGSS